jgi:hypothetical protein
MQQRNRPLLYTPFYCEENIWHLCQQDALRDRDKKVVWITGAGGICALWRQRAARQPDQPIGWDYHVVLLTGSPSGWAIWDLDTTLPCPLPLPEYLAQTFPYADQIPGEFQPRFRIVDADDFLSTFSSDRSHMLDAGGRYRKTPPPWPAIGADRPSNFARWLDPTDPIAEPPISLAAMIARFRVV